MDPNALKVELLSHNWGRFFALNCPIAAWDYLYKFICEIIDAICPMREFRILDSQPPWHTCEIISASREWERLHRIRQRTGDPDRKKEANETRNSLKSLITNTKKSFDQRYLYLFSNDSKRF